MSNDHDLLGGAHRTATIVHRAFQTRQLPAISDEPDETSTKRSTGTKTIKRRNDICMSIMYGMINAAVVAPVMMSFGSIIYGHEAFEPFLPMLIKLTLVSAMVHQLCFSTLSSLPFAVGQVQDSGLIFLSRMAVDIVNFCRDRAYNDETLLATATVGLSLATAMLGLGLMLIGKLRLASFVQKLPKCVVGGYLAFIGWFCGRAGVAIMMRSDHITVPALIDNIILVSPGVLGGLIIYTSVRTLKHVAVLPVGIILLLVIFYVGLWSTGTTVEEAKVYGWIRESEPGPVWFQIWDHVRISKVKWSALVQLLPTEISMVFVVALSSSLDVAAIELELEEALDYDRELSMVGVSNVVSGLTGGYTGSYIFSQSILSLRAGIRSRLSGYVVAICEAIIVTAPIPIMSYVPNFFYGAMLCMICIDLLHDWLWAIRLKVTHAEHMICISTFCLTLMFGVESGILFGLAIYAVCHRLDIDVGEVKVTKREIGTSNAMHTFPKNAPTGSTSNKVMDEALKNLLTPANAV